MVFLVIALLSLITFYSIYFGKMIIQRKNGIKTNQMSKGNKEMSLKIQESVMRIITLLIVPVELISIILELSIAPNYVRYLGSVIGIVGVIVFYISIYTMRDSWRAGITDEKTDLITTGVYQYSRNPAFIGFYLLYLGILLAFFNYYLLVITIFAIVSLHLQIIQEEKSLVETFGSTYIAYMKRVRRYLGRK